MFTQSNNSLAPAVEVVDRHIVTDIVSKFISTSHTHSLAAASIIAVSGSDKEGGDCLPIISS